MKNRTKLLIVLVAIAATVQILLLVYKNFTGFVPIRSMAQFVVSFVVGTTGSMVIGAGILAIDLPFIRWLDRIFPWQQLAWIRAIVEILVTILIGIAIGIVYTLIWNTLFVYHQPLGEVLFYNIVITLIVNVIIVTGTEAVFFYTRHQESALQAEQLKRENLRMQFETLKKQLDPHFLFNSLNTLSSLIRIDPERATDFIDEFSSVYRYTLEVIDEPVVIIQKELDFARSYLSLQSIRFPDAIEITIDVESSWLHNYIPPLAVQSLLENAFKHNAVSRENPLRINISAGDQGVVVKNNLQPKSSDQSRKGVGFENLKQRYRLISDRLPEVTITGKEYRVTLPYIELE